MCCCPTGSLAAFLFFANRYLILRSEHAIQRAFYALPVLVTITVFM